LLDRQTKGYFKQAKNAVDEFAEFSGPDGRYKANFIRFSEGEKEGTGWYSATFKVTDGPFKDQSQGIYQKLDDHENFSLKQKLDQLAIFARRLGVDVDALNDWNELFVELAGLAEENPACVTQMKTRGKYQNCSLIGLDESQNGPVKDDDDDYDDDDDDYDDDDDDGDEED